MTLLAGAAIVHAGLQFQLGGTWRPAGQAPLALGASPSWNADLVRGEGDTVSGRVTVAGSSVLSGANFQGQLSGNQLVGALTDDHGTTVATIVGTLEKGAFNGQYTTTQGATGAFSWESAAF